MMGLLLEILWIVLPIVIVGGICIFVINRLQQKQKKGTLGKKKTKQAQILLDSLIPIGMGVGCAAGVILSLFFPVSPLYTVSLGTGFGYLFGYFAYEIYSQMGNNES